MSSREETGQPDGASQHLELPAIPLPSTISSKAFVQLCAGIVCMAMVANLQYGWTIFINPIDAKYHWVSTGVQR